MVVVILACPFFGARAPPYEIYVLYVVNFLDSERRFFNEKY